MIQSTVTKYILMKICEELLFYVRDSR